MPHRTTREPCSVADGHFFRPRFANLALLPRVPFRILLSAADQGDDNEEAGDANDEGINGILARSEEEAVLFREMDIRGSAKLRKRGRHLLPLVRLEELPDCYRADEPFEIADVVDEIEGRGRHRRTVVNHNDGLDDEQWAVALEDGEDANEVADRIHQFSVGLSGCLVVLDAE
jgi:hypothetical protein